MADDTGESSTSPRSSHRPRPLRLRHDQGGCDRLHALAGARSRPGITVKHSLSEEGRRRIVGHSALCRLAEANDIASMVEYLLGEGGRNITATVATVDAGNSA